MLTLADVQAARARIAGGVPVTPCTESIPLSELLGCRIYCKLDYLQRTGSFKERGARNETSDRAHIAKLFGAIRAAGIDISPGANMI